MKYFWIKKNGQYIRNFIPAKRKSDNVVGMYDLANDVFYISENQYPFIGGDGVDYWQHSLRKLGTATEIIQSGDTIYADGTAATLSLKGNTVQNGTPTPDNPVDVNGVGVRTENIVDWNTWMSSIVDIYGGGSYTATATSISITSGTNTDAYTVPYNIGNPTTYRLKVKPNTKYSISIDGSGSYQLILWKNGISSSGYGRYFNSERKFTTITTDSETTFFTLRAANTGSLGSTATLSNVMIVEGEYTTQTMPAYEPYGYKIGVLSGGVTTNIYLGSTQTVRAIKKLVLDGTENWSEGPCAIGYRFVLPITSAMQSDTTIGVRSMCTHQILVGTGETYRTLGAYTITNISELLMTLNGDTRLASWKSWLAAQYANGTPVTVWYVLTTPETATVNEPLMKIGDYADTLSNATAIPTTEGANSITVDTTVQPSEFTVTWTGWHDANVKEWDGSDWQ
jgi:hypothetical protein